MIQNLKYFFTITKSFLSLPIVTFYILAQIVQDLQAHHNKMPLLSKFMKLQFHGQLLLDHEIKFSKLFRRLQDLMVHTDGFLHFNCL